MRRDAPRARRPWTSGRSLTSLEGNGLSGGYSDPELFHSKLLEGLMGRISVLKEFWEFLRVRKKLWLTPIVAMLVLLGALILFTSSSVAPFIYTLF
jgi:hypothetical protein